MLKISGVKKTARRPLMTVATPPAPSAPELSLDMLGGDSESTAKRLMRGQVSATIANAERPSNILFQMTEPSNYWYMYSAMDWYFSEVSILSTIKLRSTAELFRHDLDFVPAFALKCEECGHEMQYMTTACRSCGGVHLRRPDPTQKDYFKRPNGKSFLEEANDSGQSLKDVMKSYAASQYQNNQGYVLSVTADFIDPETGALLKATPLEFIAYDPKYVMCLHDETGKGGTVYGFVRSDRESVISLDLSDDAVNDFTSEGEMIYPAYWKIGDTPGATGRYWCYTQEEVYQDHWFTPSLTYGVPIWFDIEDDLLTYHYMEKHFHKRFKYGYVRKMVILPGFNEDDMDDITEGIQSVLARNDNSIPIVCIPPQISGTAEMKAQTLELGTEDSSQTLQVKNDIRDRICAHAGIPNIFVGDAEASGGMNNESQQITVFDRYLMDKYNYVDSLCDWFVSWFPKITDWKLRVNRPSKAYTDAKRRVDKIQEAQMMKSMGFDIHFDDGDFYYSEEPQDQIERKKEEAMANQQQIADGGMIPGDGDGPPEKGTARREDAEIGASKDEIDLAKREAEDSME